MPKRETGGEIQTERADFQYAWGLDRIVSLHSLGSSYAMLFESHDDILELDDETNASKIVFYQVKTTKSRAWTVAGLTSRPKKGKDGRNASIAGKMFDGVKRFSPAAERIVLVSNAPFAKLSLDPGEECFTKLDAKCRTAFSSSMKDEDASYLEPAHIGYFHFNFSTLYFDNPDDTVVGRIARLLTARTGSDKGAKLFYDAMITECRRKARPQHAAKTAAEFDAAHIIKKSEVEVCLQIHEDRSGPVWSEVSGFLEFKGYGEHTAIGKAWRQHVSDRTKRWATIRKIGPEIAAIVAPFLESGENFETALPKAVEAARSKVHEWNPTADDAAVAAILLYEHRRI